MPTTSPASGLAEAGSVLAGAVLAGAEGPGTTLADGPAPGLTAWPAVGLADWAEPFPSLGAGRAGATLALHPAATAAHRAAAAAAASIRVTCISPTLFARRPHRRHAGWNQGETQVSLCRQSCPPSSGVATALGTRSAQAS